MRLTGIHVRSRAFSAILTDPAPPALLLSAGLIFAAIMADHDWVAWALAGATAGYSLSGST